MFPILFGSPAAHPAGIFYPDFPYDAAPHAGRRERLFGQTVSESGAAAVLLAIKSGVRYDSAMDDESLNAYRELANALENFNSAVHEFKDPDSPAVLRAADRLADAYTVYDDAIFTRFGIEAPFDTYAEETEDSDSAFSAESADFAGDEDDEEFDSEFDDEFDDGGFAYDDEDDLDYGD